MFGDYNNQEESEKKDLYLSNIRDCFDKEIKEYELKISGEKSILDKLDPIESCDDVKYELELQLMALKKLYKKMFN